MSVTFTWENHDKTQLRFIFDTLWQIDDLQRVIDYSRGLMEERNQTVDVIIDMSNCDSMPSNLSLLRDHLRTLDSQRVGVMVFVTHNVYVQKAMQLINQLLRNQFVMYFTDSLDDAHRIVRRATITREHYRA